MSQEKDYVLGTHDDEIERLALQHRVWRPRTLDAWQRAGFNTGQTILDIGCGPGYATLDLADMVGPSGHVVAIDRSRRFLDTLDAARNQRGLRNITIHEFDLDETPLPPLHVDGAWSRWVFAFVQQPRDLLARVAGVMKPGGTFVLHEYFDYSTWRMAPRSPEMEEFVAAVMGAWRASGGEPDIGLDLPTWLEELGFEIRTVRPIVDVIPPTSFIWQWPKAFIQIGLERMVHLGQMNAERAQEIATAIGACEARPHTRMITPAVLEIIAVRR